LLISILACSGTQVKPDREKINYSQIFVEQEGGYRFEKITDEQDSLAIDSTSIDRFDNISTVSYNLYDLSPDKESIAYMSRKLSNEDSSVNVFVKSLKNLNMKQQRTFVDFALDPSFSGDSEQLAYCYNRAEQLSVFIVGAKQGSAVQQITKGITSTKPFFNPSQRVVFFQQTEIVGKKRTVVYDNVTEQDVETWENKYESYIWSHNLDNGAVTQYTRGYDASFFPDGQRIVLLRDAGNYNEIWIVELTTGKEYLLLADKTRGFHSPRVSPDGNRIAFTTRVKGKFGHQYDVHVINADGSNLTQLTFHPGHDIQPRWGADDELYFASQRGSQGGDFNIWRVQIQGSATPKAAASTAVAPSAAPTQL
jgi:Tol biopolymer transport system component